MITVNVRVFGMKGTGYTIYEEFSWQPCKFFRLIRGLLEPVLIRNILRKKNLEIVWLIFIRYIRGAAHESHITSIQTLNMIE